MEIVYLIIGLIVGCVAGWGLTSRKNAVLAAELKMQETHAREMLDAERRRLEEKLAEQKREVEELHKRSALEFESLADKIFRQRLEMFNRQSTESLGALLKPFGDNLKEFKHRVE